MAAMFIGLLAVMYVEMVWKPYFDSDQKITEQAQETAATSNKQASTAISSSIPTGESVKGIQSGSSVADGVVPTDGQYPSNELIATYPSLSISTNTFDASITLLGGRLSSLKLQEHKDGKEDKTSGYDLVAHHEGTPLPLGVSSGEVDDSRTIYRLASSSANLSGDTYTVKGDSDIILEGTLADGRTINKQFSFKPDGYLFDVVVTVSSSAKSAERVALDWVWLVSADELSATMRDPYKAPAWVWFDDQKVHRLKLGDYVSLSENDLRSKGPADVRWLTIGTKYFVAGLFSPDSLAGAQLFHQDDVFRMRVLGGDVSGKFRVFAGPKSYELLEDVGYRFDRNIDFGFFELFSAPLLSLLLFFNKIFGNYALAIILLTILVKAATYPLNAASFRSMKKMQELAPEIKKLQENITDKNVQRQKMMEIYQKRGVNPMGGCLPMIIQMPIFFGLFVALNVAVELRHADFAFWINDLSEPEKLMITDSFGIPVMVVLMVISMMVQQWLTPSTMDATQKL
jgi:YidC/Oxa1 family membrane protein insertase